MQCLKQIEIFQTIHGTIDGLVMLAKTNKLPLLVFIPDINLTANDVAESGEKIF